MLIMLKFWTEILLSILLVCGGYLAYEKIKRIGYDEAEAKYELVIIGYQNQISNQIISIENKSNVLVTESRETAATIKSGIATLILTTKNKPLVVVKNGECNPTQVFSETFGKVNRQVNRSIKP